jgi:outer membrane protein assembly factor BamB
VLWDGLRGSPEATAWRRLEKVEGEIPASWVFRSADVTWNYEPGIGVWSAPAVARIGDRAVCFVGSYDHNLYALDAATGKELWRFPTGNGIYSTPAVVRVGGRDCVLAASSDRTLYCVDAVRGIKIWAYETYEWKPSLGRAFLASPIIVPGKDGPNVLEVSWIYDRAPGGVSEIAEVRAIGLETGRLRWRRAFAQSHPTHPVCTKIGGRPRLYIGCRDGNLYCLSGENGEEIWRRTSKMPLDGTPAIAKAGDGRTLVLAGTKFGELRAFDAASGEPAWTFKAGHWIDATPAIVESDKGRRVAVVGSYDGRVYCLDVNSGRQVWRYATRGNVIASTAIRPVGAGFEAFAASDDDMLHAIDGRSGRGLWQFSPGPFQWAFSGMGDTLWPSPAAVRIGEVDVLIVPHNDGRVHAYRLDRAKQWLPAMTGDPGYGRAMLGRIGLSMLGTLALAMVFCFRHERAHKT